MFHKTLIGLAVCFGLTACAQRTPPQADAASRNYAQAIVGKWHCTFESDLLNVTSEDDIRADGTWLSQSKLDVLVYQKIGYHYQLNSKDSWRIDGDEVVVKGVSVSNVREVPAQDPAERILMAAFDSDNPEFKSGLLSAVSKVDESETRAKILRLTDTDLEVQVEDLPEKTVCRRAG